MSRKIPLVAALLAAALVIPTTAAQAADSGLTPTVSPFSYGGPAGGSELLRLDAPNRAHKHHRSRTSP